MSLLKMKKEMLHLNLGEYPHIPNSELFKIAKCLPKLCEGGPWIAGGSVWRTVNNEPLINCDVDVFFPCKEQYEEMRSKMNSYPYVNNILSEKKNKWNTVFQIHVNEGSFNKTIDVQFVGMSYYNRLEKLLNSFDFPVCQFGYNGRDIIMGEKALSDLQKRQLSIHRLAHPKSFLRHMLKYLNNGFTLPPEELKNVTSQILESNAWSKNATGKYDECNDDCRMVEVGFDIEANVDMDQGTPATYISPWDALRDRPVDERPIPFQTTLPQANLNGDVWGGNTTVGPAPAYLGGNIITNSNTAEIDQYLTRSRLTNYATDTVPYDNTQIQPTENREPILQELTEARRRFIEITGNEPPFRNATPNPNRDYRADAGTPYRADAGTPVIREQRQESAVERMYRLANVGGRDNSEDFSHVVPRRGMRSSAGNRPIITRRVRETNTQPVSNTGVADASWGDHGYHPYGYNPNPQPITPIPPGRSIIDQEMEMLRHIMPDPLSSNTQDQHNEQR